ncbi:MAG: UDP-N-acetylmuramoyl-L-alanyl-D-glutamate--2,6-diaminopimelate ligase [Candidatus Limnocylindrales bacterium]
MTSGAAERALAEMIAAAEPKTTRRLGELIERLEAEGRLRTVRLPEAPAGASAGSAGLGSLPIRGIAFDSRRVQSGSVFVAVPGEHVDGHDYVPAAVALGAAAAIVERLLPGVAAPQIVVDRSRAALAVAAAWWYGDPSRELGVVGITGTDGKTTTSFLAAAVLEAAGISTGLLTTAELKVGDLRSANAEHVTTPEAPQLQLTLRAMVEAGNRAAVVETTSHGLALDRVGGVAYDVAVFTNLTHEHLELHGTFEAYREAKLSLFRRLRGDPLPRKRLPRRWPRAAIVNHDDPSASLFEAAALSAGAALVRYGLSPEADVRAVAVEEDARQLRVHVRTPRWSGEVTLALVGRFNVHNALAALALGEALELEPAAIRAGLADVRGVPGRMERVDRGQPFGVIVDYAHSPASLQTVLDQLAPLAAAGGGLIAVFGSAGERDVQKRPLMGRIAGERCRLVVVTDEDPRGEDREAILDEIAAGAEAAGKHRGEDLICIPDRRDAIAAAFERAGPGDVVLLAGKGHEQSIIMSDGPHAWDERTEAIAALGRMGFRRDERPERY